MPRHEFRDDKNLGTASIPGPLSPTTNPPPLTDDGGGVEGQ